MRIDHKSAWSLAHIHSKHCEKTILELFLSSNDKIYVLHIVISVDLSMIVSPVVKSEWQNCQLKWTEEKEEKFNAQETLWAFYFWFYHCVICVISVNDDVRCVNCSTTRQHVKQQPKFSSCFWFESHAKHRENESYFSRFKVRLNALNRSKN